MALTIISVWRNLKTSDFVHGKVIQLLLLWGWTDINSHLKSFSFGHSNTITMLWELSTTSHVFLNLLFHRCFYPPVMPSCLYSYLASCLSWLPSCPSLPVLVRSPNSSWLKSPLLALSSQSPLYLPALWPFPAYWHAEQDVLLRQHLLAPALCDGHLHALSLLPNSKFFKPSHLCASLLLP